MFLLVPLDVLQQVVGPDKGPAAGGADKLLLARVSSLVARQLVTTGENLVTVLVRTVEGFLS